MTVHRFAAAIPIDSDLATIAESELHHLRDVLRLRAGDRIVVSDGAGGQFSAVLETVGADSAVARVLERLAAPRTSRITLLQAVLKSSKMNLVVAKATELGVAEVVPMIAKRSVARVEPEAVAGKRARWQRVADEASKQCGRPVPPVVKEPVDVARAAEMLAGFDAAVLFWEAEGEAPVAAALADADPDGRIAVVIGPEGGFESVEARTLEAAGAVAAGLGPLTLRSETAAIAGLAVVMYELRRDRGARHVSEARERDGG